jgi:hypothetical protein
MNSDKFYPLDRPEYQRRSAVPSFCPLYTSMVESDLETVDPFLFSVLAFLSKLFGCHPLILVNRLEYARSSFHAITEKWDRDVMVWI